MSEQFRSDIELKNADEFWLSDSRVILKSIYFFLAGSRESVTEILDIKIESAALLSNIGKSGRLKEFPDEISAKGTE